MPRVRRSGNPIRLEASSGYSTRYRPGLTRAYEIAADTVAKVVKDAVPVRLEHLCVRIEARIAELGDLLGEKLDPVGRVAKDDGLVDLKLLDRTHKQVSTKPNPSARTHSDHLL
jgi:hypothetical protein